MEWTFTAATITLLVTMATSQDITITGIFEHDDGSLSQAFQQASKTVGRLHPNVQTKTIDTNGSIASSLRHLCDHSAPLTSAFIAFGSNPFLGLVAEIGRQTSAPTLGYGTNGTGFSAKAVGGMYLQLDSSHKNMAKAVARLLKKGNWFSVTIIIEDVLDNGFVQGFDEIMTDASWKLEDKITLTSSDTSHELESKLVDLLDNRSRVNILHCNPALANKVFQVANRKGYIGEGYAWIITGSSVHSSATIYPTGLVVVNSLTTRDVISAIIQDAVLHVATILSNYATSNPENWTAISSKRSCWNESNRGMDQWHVGHQILDLLENTVTVGKRGNFFFDKDGSRGDGEFTITNSVRQNRTTQWKEIGTIDQTGISLQSVVWPGGTVSGPISSGPQTWRIVTNIVDPFVSERALPDGSTKCIAMATCLRFTKPTKDKNTIDNIFRDYANGIINQSRPYKIRCCKGLSIDLLERLAKDLNFDYQMYIVSDEKYGGLVNGQWNGLVEDVMKGNAHLAVAAFSITSSRSRVIDYSSPYYYSGFSMLTSEREKEIPIDAFLHPFSIQEWVLMFVCATVTIVAMALLEWKSPFGLNPWGRRRERNYSLSSATTMVFAVFFGHTMPTKTPKSWPGKWLQNLWAGVAIFIVASYTANLAAYIAGNTQRITVQSIHDPQLLQLRVAGLHSSSSLSMLGQINPQLYKNVLKTTANTSDKGIDMLRNNKADIFIDDTPVLDYARSQDKACKLQAVGTGFAEDSYGIGLSKGLWFKKPLSEKITEYHMSGYIEKLQYIHFGSSVCVKAVGYGVQQMELGLENTAGLFVMLATTIGGICVLLLGLEHVLFRWFVPWVRQKPEDSKWRGYNLMFFSQRLHRIVNCQEIMSPHHAAREMITLVKAGDITKLFQKSVKKSEKAKVVKMGRDMFDIVQTAHSVDRIQRSAVPSPQLPGDKTQQEEDIETGRGSPSSSLCEADQTGVGRHEQNVDVEVHSSNNASSYDSQNNPPTQLSMRKSQCYHNNVLSCANRQGDSPNVLTSSGVKHDSNYAKEMNNAKGPKHIPVKDNRFIEKMSLRQKARTPLVLEHSAMGAELDVDRLTKEELLVMWKTSELEQQRQLREVLKDKAKLEQKLNNLSPDEQKPVYV